MTLGPVDHSSFEAKGRRALSGLIDLTLLAPNATESDIAALALKGIQQQVAALCVLPQHLDFIPNDASITRATVVNFPTGKDEHHEVLASISHVATHKHINEIDYVFPRHTYLAGDQASALSSCQEAWSLCKKHGLIFKVILETGALPSAEVIYQLSLDVINSGCDFLKTSTGKIETGATIEAAKAMLSAIINSKAACGIKISGGIRTAEQTLSYIQLAEDMTGRTVDKNWFRLGTSQSEY